MISIFTYIFIVIAGIILLVFIAGLLCRMKELQPVNVFIMLPREGV